MDELTAILLTIQDRLEALIHQVESGALYVTEIDNARATGASAGGASAGGSESHLRALREQRDDLDKAIALARNPQRKVY